MTTPVQRPAPARPTAGPTRWKMWVLLTSTIYPLILLIATLTDPLMRLLPPALRFLVVVPVMTATMVWVVLPWIQRRFGRWLAR